MNRKLVTAEELRTWMNERLRQTEEGADCQFDGVLRLREADDSGCNWSLPVLRCSGIPSDVCQPVAHIVITEAREKFNLN